METKILFKVQNLQNLIEQIHSHFFFKQQKVNFEQFLELANCIHYVRQNFGQAEANTWEK